MTQKLLQKPWIWLKNLSASLDDNQTGTISFAKKAGNIDLVHVKKTKTTDEDVDMEAGNTKDGNERTPRNNMHKSMAGSSNDHDKLGKMGKLEHMETHHL